MVKNYKGLEHLKSMGIDQLKDLSANIRKEIIFESEDITNSEISKLEAKLIKQFKANNPVVGYNQWPKFKE